MDNNIDVVEQLKIKNHELYINKMIIDLENTMESFILFYNNFCDSFLKEIVSKITFLLDDSQNSDKKTMTNNTILSFFTMYKENVKNEIDTRTKLIRDYIKENDISNYNKKLNSEALLIVNQITDYYHENINMLIDELSQYIKNNELYFKDYLLNTVRHKLINTLSVQLMYSVKLINNNSDENTMMLQTINEKTLK